MALRAVAGSYSTDFVDISASIVILGSGDVLTTNYLDVGAATNQASVRLSGDTGVQRLTQPGKREFVIVEKAHLNGTEFRPCEQELDNGTLEPGGHHHRPLPPLLQLRHRLHEPAGFREFG